MSPSTSSTDPGSDDSPTLLEVGYIAKAHGIGGDVLVNLTTNRTERVDVGSRLTSPDGRVFEVRRSRPHQNKWIVGFDGVADRSTAEQLRGTKLLAAAIVDAAELWVHELVGATVVEKNGTARGTVVSVEANPSSDMLVLSDGHLVPVAFVVEHDSGLVTIDPPEGLFDL